MSSIQEDPRYPCVNWIEATVRALDAQFPDCEPCSRRLTLRLSALLLESLPPEEAEKLLDLLPGDLEAEVEQLRTYASCGAERSIGYPEFLTKTAHLLGLESVENIDEASRKATDIYLWSIARDFPPDVKQHLTHALPSELRSRMDLYNATAEQAKVA